MNLRPSPLPKFDKMPIRVPALAFDLCVLCYIAAHVPYSSLSSKIREKKVTARPIVLLVNGQGPPRYTIRLEMWNTYILIRKTHLTAKRIKFYLFALRTE
jgi:hypothetical protein